MELRSTRAKKRERTGVIIGLENVKSPVVKWKLRSADNQIPVEKVANEAARVLSLRSNQSISVNNGSNEAEIGTSVDHPDEDELNSDDKGVFLGSEVLDPVKDLPVSSQEGEIEEESVKRVRVKRQKKSSNNGLKEEIKSPSECDTKFVHGDDGMDKIVQKRGRGRPRKDKRKISNIMKKETEVVNVESGIVKQKRGRKRKNVEIGIVKQKRGRKRKNVEIGILKQKRGRKRKNVEIGILKQKMERKRKIVGVRNKNGERMRVLGLRCVAVTSGDVAVDAGRPEKKVERRGRPRKVEIPLLPLRKRGRPRKIEGQISQPKKKKEKVSNKKRLKDMIVKKIKMRKRKLNLIAINGVKKGHKGIMGKGKCIKLIREKLLDILLKAGWSIDRRPRLDRVYQDMVYIEPNGRAHWSITRAYAKLKKKVKDGDADKKEVNAYISIPNEEIGVLFRHVDKELGYKKKKNRKLIKKELTPKKKKKDGKKGIIVKGRKPRLLARDSEKGSKRDKRGRLLYIKKRNLLTWMIDSGVISSGWKVKYGKTRRKHRVSEGTISYNGIDCGCCNKVMSVSEFISHFGGKVDIGFDNIYLESGVTFRKCLLDSWKKEEDLGTVKYNVVDVKGDDPNDDTCNICGDGGNLICCDSCPSTFHQSCLDIQNFPPGDWNCIYCSCKFCGVVAISTPDSRDENSSEMLTCGLCEEKFHQSCLSEVGPVDNDSNKLSFCGQKCQELFERIQKDIGVKHELEDGFSWTFLRRSDITPDLTYRETRSKVEINSKLAVAFSVMDECFLPIVDGRSGTVIIRNVVYNCGSNFRRLNYAGFLTVVLEKGDELITAASIRLHGSRLAEMPFIGTRHNYRRQGMCRRLLDAIESTLSSFGVEELIIPAIPDLIKAWTKVFGFAPLEESKKQEIKSLNMMVFPGINMLQKPLIQIDKKTPSDAIDCNEVPVDVAEITKDAIDHEKPDFNEMPVDEAEITKNAIDHEKPDCNEMPIDEAEITKDAIDHEKPDCLDYEQMKEDIIIMDKVTLSNGDHNMYDLNLSDCPLKPCSTGSATCGPDQSPESESRVENDVIPEVDGSLLTSKLVLKNTFDLNMHPTVVDSDMHIVGDTGIRDSRPSDTPTLVVL